MSIKLITAPTGLAVSLVEAKAHIRVDTTDDDTLITAMIGAATDAAEQMTGRAIMSQTWEITLDEFPDEFELTRVPVQLVTSITYKSTAGVSTVYSQLLYTLDTTDDFGVARIYPIYNGEWPDTLDDNAAVAVRYLAGYASAAAVPESIKSWIKLMVGAMYDNRAAETVASGSVISLGFADRLLDRYKVWNI